MSTTVTPQPPVADDQVIERTVLAERPRSWWQLPTALTVLALAAFVLFGLRVPSGAHTTFQIAREGNLNPGGVIPETVDVPSAATAIVLAVLCLAIATFFWWASATIRGLDRRVRVTLLVVFGVLWVLSFLTWVNAGISQAVDLGSILQATLALAVPLTFGALSGVLSERAGLVNIAIEGQLLFGAFGAALVSSLVGGAAGPWAGLVAAPIMALVIGALLALFAVGYHVQQIIVGVVLNVFAVGLTSFFFGSVMQSDPARFNAPSRLPSWRIPVLADIPLVGRVLFDQNILVYLMWVIVALLTVALFRTRWGLRVRAVGEHPRAADTVGIDVARTRWTNVLMGSAVAGLGGATLTIGTNVAFGENMSAGKGYIALAAMILGRYHPVGALLAALMFAFADALQLRLSGGGRLPSEFLLMLPYIVTLFAVAGVVGRVRVPAADGEPYVKE
ncbi:ABC transporter permease [Brachybacterium huguangmaarense]|uniref:ABC transporter permease n=1 Tax=Brachybacterium huguangmaarense TaxID=1652028 RepID=A0ABY6FXK3_9MICO|nr:ABC transporter permease [Brachybacterium huguangmaarense]UYG15659.1 ABC transporter permease [Brachybacterium huguangmaarense]